MLDFSSLFRRHLKSSVHQSKRGRKTKGQSLVELAIALPIIILLFSGLVEFGFILNYYLSLLDATREAARFYSNVKPFNDDHSENAQLYEGAADMVLKNLQPRDLGEPQVLDNTRKIILDPAADDIIVVVLNVTDAGITRYPSAGDYHYFGNHESRLGNDDVNAQLVADAPNTAILLVEVFYNYHQVLALPWLTPFVPDPVLLHAYTMMPMPPITTTDAQPCIQFDETPSGCNQFAFINDMLMPFASTEAIARQEKSK